MIAPANRAVFPHSVEKLIKNSFDEYTKEKYGIEYFNQKDNDDIDGKRENIAKIFYNLSNHYRSEKFNLNIYKDEFSYLYLLWYLPLNFHKLQFIFLDLFEKQYLDPFKLPPSLSFLDVGAGPGTTTLAVIDFFDLMSHLLQLFNKELNLKKIRIVSLEGSKDNIRLFNKIIPPYKKLIEKNEKKLEIEVETPIEINFDDKNIGELISERNFDFITVSDVLNEIKGVRNSKTIFLNNLKPLLKKDGLLLLVEPAIRKETEELRQIQKELVEKYHWNLLGPCGQVGEKAFCECCDKCWSFRRENLRIPEIMRIIEDKIIEKKFKLFFNDVKIEPETLYEPPLCCFPENPHEEMENYFDLKRRIEEAVEEFEENELKPNRENYKKTEESIKERLNGLKKEEIRENVQDFLDLSLEGTSRQDFFCIVKKAIQPLSSEEVKAEERIDERIRFKCEKCGEILKVRYRAWYKDGRFVLRCDECEQDRKKQSDIKKEDKNLYNAIIDEEQYLKINRIARELEKFKELKSLFLKSSIENILKEKIKNVIEEDHYLARGYRNSRLKWSYSILSPGIFRKKELINEGKFEVVGGPFSPQSENFTIYKICNQRIINPLYLRITIPENIKYGSIIPLEGIDSRKITEKEEENYKKVFGKDPKTAGSEEYLIDDEEGGKLLRITDNESEEKSVKRIFSYFKEYYSESRKILRDGLNNGKEESETIKTHQDLEVKKENLVYFLRRIFSDKKDFWEGQFYSIINALSGVDTLTIMLTGGGKSLCYQLPSFLLPGVTIVISPLMSLMEDQYNNLLKIGLDQITFINSSILPDKQIRRRKRMEKGYYKIIYLTPEQLEKSSIRDSLKKTNENVGITYFVIDEAHCVSLWGHDFRPSYLFLKKKAEDFGSPAIIGLTATASQKVRDNLMKEYGLEENNVIFQNFFRKNLILEVREVKDNEERLNVVKKLARKNSDKSPLFFTPYTIPKEEDDPCLRAEALSTELNAEGINSEWYHSRKKGRNKKEFEHRRKRVQENFINNKSKNKFQKVDVLCATKGFGMGIDKPDIELVCHPYMPFSLEDYYQQIGRAARDKETIGRCILLHNNLPVNCNEKCWRCKEERRDCYKQAFLVKKDYEENGSQKIEEQVRIFADVINGKINIPAIFSFKEKNILLCQLCQLKNKYLYLNLDEKGEKKITKKKLEQVLNLFRKRDIISEFYKVYGKIEEMKEIDYNKIQKFLDNNYSQGLTNSIIQILKDKNDEKDLINLSKANNIILRELNEIFQNLEERQFLGFKFKETCLEVVSNPSKKASEEDIHEITEKYKEVVKNKTAQIKSFIKWIKDEKTCRKDALLQYFFSNEILDSSCFACDVCLKKLKDDEEVKKEKINSKKRLKEKFKEEEFEEGIEFLKTKQYYNPKIANFLNNYVILSKADKGFLILEHKIESGEFNFPEDLNKYAKKLKEEKYRSREYRVRRHYDDKDKLFTWASYILGKLSDDKNEKKKYYLQSIRSNVGVYLKNLNKFDEELIKKCVYFVEKENIILEDLPKKGLLFEALSLIEETDIGKQCQDCILKIGQIIFENQAEFQLEEIKEFYNKHLKNRNRQDLEVKKHIEKFESILDIEVKCEGCGHRFLLTKGERRKYQERGWDTKLCRDCLFRIYQQEQRKKKEDI